MRTPSLSTSGAASLTRRARRRLARAIAPQPTAEPVGPARPAETLQRVRRRLVKGRCHPAELEQTRLLMRAFLADGRHFDDGDRRAVADAFEGLWQPRSQPVGEPPAYLRDVIRDQFHRMYYHVSARTWKDTTYCGIPTYKCPTDMWVYQEIIDALRPGLVVETGTFRGGSALFLAHRLELLGEGQVVTVDVEVHGERPSHPRLTYLEGSSVSETVLDAVRQRIPHGRPVLVILDSDHSQEHVAHELASYADLVTPGSYLIVEDTNVNGHPAAPDHGPGPFEAVEEFLRTDARFEPDPRGERYYLTQNPSGYLRRVPEPRPA